MVFVWSLSWTIYLSLQFTRKELHTTTISLLIIMFISSISSIFITKQSNNLPFPCKITYCSELTLQQKKNEPDPIHSFPSIPPPPFPPPFLSILTPAHAQPRNRMMIRLRPGILTFPARSRNLTPLAITPRNLLLGTS
jgi:hypothetical protein